MSDQRPKAGFVETLGITTVDASSESTRGNRPCQCIAICTQQQAAQQQQGCVRVAVTRYTACSHTDRTTYKPTDPNPTIGTALPTRTKRPPKSARTPPAAKWNTLLSLKRVVSQAKIPTTLDTQLLLLLLLEESPGTLTRHERARPIYRSRTRKHKYVPPKGSQHNNNNNNHIQRPANSTHENVFFVAPSNQTNPIQLYNRIKPGRISGLFRNNSCDLHFSGGKRHQSVTGTAAQSVNQGHCVAVTGTVQLTLYKQVAMPACSS